MSFAVEYRLRAQDDIDRLYSWIAVRSPAGAMRWYAALREAIAKIGEHPLVFGLAWESRRTGQPIRETFFKTPRGRRYRVLFLVGDDVVQILRVCGPGQPPVRKRDL